MVGKYHGPMVFFEHGREIPWVNGLPKPWAYKPPIVKYEFTLPFFETFSFKLSFVFFILFFIPFSSPFFPLFIYFLILLFLIYRDFF
jgi:hypothetical protein